MQQIKPDFRVLGGALQDEIEESTIINESLQQPDYNQKEIDPCILEDTFLTHLKIEELFAKVDAMEKQEII